jgi:bacteriorhodopsin
MIIDWDTIVTEGIYVVCYGLTTAGIVVITTQQQTLLQNCAEGIVAVIPAILAILHSYKGTVKLKTQLKIAKGIKP